MSPGEDAVSSVLSVMERGASLKTMYVPVTFSRHPTIVPFKLFPCPSFLLAGCFACYSYNLYIQLTSAQVRANQCSDLFYDLAPRSHLCIIYMSASATGVEL